ncbi:hypothetical protein ANCDUO_18724 [Ancylostoma duodenale]|uniref:Uncharacterized protein n=1 Tax=Ancylostoma duodenale TaxID=51022 RepID=A0A0C2CN75_9BILA|nr:hypothetical protein ANCDUO_18724 [Ancylostoma duodenale]
MKEFFFKDTLNGIENKAYASGGGSSRSKHRDRSRSRSRDRDRKRRRRSRSRSRSELFSTQGMSHCSTCLGSPHRTGNLQGSRTCSYDDLLLLCSQCSKMLCQ